MATSRIDYINERVDKRQAWARSSTCSRTGTRRRSSPTALDGIKNLCFSYAAKSGLTVSIDDVKTPAAKAEILERRGAEAAKVNKKFLPGHHHRR